VRISRLKTTVPGLNPRASGGNPQFGIKNNNAPITSGKSGNEHLKNRT
jgi:hypothetical protein